MKRDKRGRRARVEERMEQLIAQAQQVSVLTIPDEAETWDPREWMKEYEWIKLRGGMLGRFENWTTAQEEYAAMLWELRRDHKPVFDWLAKCRQLGISTLIEGWIFALVHHIPDRRGIVLGHQEELAKAGVFENVQYMYEYLPPKERELKPIEGGKVSHGRIAYEFPHKSTLQIFAATPEVGHSLMNNYAHMTEVGRLSNLSDICAGLFPTIPDENTWDCLFVGEGTSGGRNEFSRRYYSAKFSSTSKFRAIFFGLDKDDKAWIELDSGEEVTVPEHMIEYQQENSVPPERMKWIVGKLENEFDGDLMRFHQQHPFTDDLAFSVHGGNLFNPRIVTELRKGAQAQLLRGYPQFMTLDTMDVEIIPDRFGPLWLWKHPEPGKRYVLSGDVGMGIALDYSELHIVTVDEPHEWVAMYRSNKIRVEELGVMAWMLGAYYNFAFVGIERTGGTGLGPLIVLETGHAGYPQLTDNARYPFLYYYTRVDKSTQEETEMLGFNTSRPTKKFGITRMSELFHNRKLKIHAKWLLDQLEGFAWDPDRNNWIEQHKDDATNKPNDDAVMAAMIAVELIREYPKEYFPPGRVVNG